MDSTRLFPLDKARRSLQRPAYGESHMSINVVGIAHDIRTTTPVVYAQMSVEDYLAVIGSEFEDFSIQRRRETHKGYQRLKSDIKAGALLPSITLAIKPENVASILPILNKANLDGDYLALSERLSTPGQVDILDGLQRTYILSDLKNKDEHKFVDGQTLLVEFWLEKDLNNLIYRIIVLNAGQKPMSIRHQIELLFMSLKTSIEQRIPPLELYTERENKKRNKARKFSLGVVSSAYQAFLTRSAELHKDNVIANQLMEASALDASEEQLSQQFDDFSRYLGLYADLDDEITRIYKSSRVALEDVPTEEETAEGSRKPRPIASGAYANWLATENVMLGFFAAVSLFSASQSKANRIDAALRALIDKARSSEEGDDPLGLSVFEPLRAGNNPRKVNVGLATRRLIQNGFREYFRESGETPLAECWPIAAD